MNKKLLTIAVGTAIAATPFFAAQAADIKVYGRLEVELVATDLSSSVGPSVFGTTGDSFMTQGDGSGQSRWGIKATEDLGGGLKAIAVYEFKLGPSDDRGESNRQQYAALKGSFGEVAFGRMPGAYKMTGGAKLDPFNATFLQARRSGGQAGGSRGANGFRDDMIRYKNKFGPVSVNVQTSLDESSNDGDTTIGVMFKQGPLEVFAATFDDDSSSAGNTKFGARYKFGMFKVWIQSENAEFADRIDFVNGYTMGTLSGTWDFLLLGGSAKFGKNTVVLQIGQASPDGGSTDIDYTSLGVIHKFSKKTRVYGGIKTIDIGGFFDTTDIGGGIRIDF